MANQPWLAVVMILGACGQGSHSAVQPDGSTVPIDVATCAPAGYPEVVTPVNVVLGAPTPLALDGSGTLCEQMVRAIAGPTARLPELAGLDTTNVTGRCSHDAVTDQDTVRISAPSYAGTPTTIQQLIGHVDAQRTLVFLGGSFLPPGHAPPAGCIDGATAVVALVGRPLPYERFASCTPEGPGSRTLAADDDFVIADETVYLDNARHLRRVRAIDAYLAPSRVDVEVVNSDAFCCSTPSLQGCAGKRMYVDALTGEIVATLPHCITC